MEYKELKLKEEHLYDLIELSNHSKRVSNLIWVNEKIRRLKREIGVKNEK